MVKSLPVQLLICIVLAFLIGDYLSPYIAQLFFTLSCILKDILMFILPMVIFTYMVGGIVSLKQNAPLLILAIMIMVVASNAIAVLTSYGVATTFFPLVLHSDGSSLELVTHSAITPLWAIPFSCPLTPGISMITAIVCGIILSMVGDNIITQSVLQVRHWVNLFLQKFFIPLLPIYVFGFTVKMQREGTLEMLAKSFTQVFLLSCTLLILYVVFLYGLGNGFKKDKWRQSLKAMLPAGLTGFSTMSSAAAMPVTLGATEKNLQDANFADVIIPSTVNIHLLGDALGVPILGLAVLSLSGFPMPGFENYLLFVFYFCLAKFSSAGIPGGGVIVLLPTLQAQLNLTPEMTSLVATLYILQDSIFTFANVMANGGFALTCHRFFKFLRLVKP